MGAEWLDALPDVVRNLRSRWSLELDPPFSYPSLSYVGPALQQNAREVVLKVGFLRDELACEIAALRHYAGRGSVQILEADSDLGALLLERLLPGDCLATVSDDDQACAIAASAMRELWRSPPAQHTFPSVATWCRGLQRLRERFCGGTGPLPADAVDRAERVLADLISSEPKPMLLHGDLQHFNVLRAERKPWLAIDPKGVVGDPAFEVGAFLGNEWEGRSEPARLMARRIDVFADCLDIDRARICAWGLVQSVLSAWWCIEDDGACPESSVQRAEILTSLVG